MTFSSITLSGTIKNQAVQRFTPNNVSIISFTIDVKRYDNRTKEEKSYPVKVNLWGDAYTEQINDLSPGKSIVVIGRPQIEQYNDKEGKPQKNFTVEGSKFFFVDNLVSDSSSLGASNDADFEDPFAGTSAPSNLDMVEDEEIPF